ncbi:MAG: DUF4127 family protein [Capsulimonadaceae bacterium]
MPNKIILVPLDERPVNTRYPQMLAAIGGADLRLPPEEIRGRQRIPADLDRLETWLREECFAGGEEPAAVIVSCDYLGYGNLINARISDESAITVLKRLALLAEIGRRAPVHAFSLITRVANADDCVEEPLYWAEWGTKFARYARLHHLEERGEAAEVDVAERDRLANALPPDLIADWLTRRLRNHAVNLSLLEMTARGQIESLLLTSDDTAPHGFPTRERDWLRGWPGLIGKPLQDRVRMYPGADEVGSALTARLILGARGRSPRVFIDYAIDGDQEIVAPYEDRPVRETVLGQIEACGCVAVDEPGSADFVLGVATPSPRRTDLRSEYVEADRAVRTAPYRAFLNRLAGAQAAGVAVALADVAYPNGADPVLSELLLAPDCPLSPGALAAYGGWNTAGNTLGVVIAQAALSTLPGADPAAQARFLAHRFLEDYGYQLRVRKEARIEANSRWSRRDPDPDSNEQQQGLCAYIEGRLNEVMAELRARGVGDGLIIAPGSVRLPWRRTFEVDFDLITKSI